MDAALESLGWTEEHWSRICTTVTEEAQKARVAAQALPVTGPEDPSTEAIPNFSLDTEANPTLIAPPAGAGALLPPRQRLSVDSDPTLYLSTIAVNVQLRSSEVADPDLKAALVAFRRAANYIARIEDALVFNGRGAPDSPPLGTGSANIPPVFRVTGGGLVPGILWPTANKLVVAVPPGGATAGAGGDIVSAVTTAVDLLDAAGQLGPYACLLGHELFEEAVTPNQSLVLPRDRILPFLGGPLLRASTIPARYGAVIALSGSPVEIVVASDIGVRFLQTTPEPRYVFRVSERIAVRIKEDSAIAVLRAAEDRPQHAHGGAAVHAAAAATTRGGSHGRS